MNDTKIDAKEFRSALGAFLTGVTVVTTRDGDRMPRGFTANSFTSVSLDPPLVLVCLAKSASSYPAFRSCERFAINVLAENQKDVSSTFASKIADRFAQVAWREGALGCPLIEGATSWFECRMHEQIDAGDHIVLIGRVIGFGKSDAMPLGYCRGTYVNLGLSQAAIAAHQRSRVGAILERDGAVLLVGGADGKLLSLPSGSSLGPASDPKSLAAAFIQLGITVRLGFLFSVFEDHQGEKGVLSIYYRGTLDGDWPTRTDAHPVELDRMPWVQLADDNERRMLRRYVKERQEDAFGIYSGNTMTVEPLSKRESSPAAESRAMAR